VKWRLELGGVAIALLACGELADPRANRVALSIVPVFDASGVFAGNNADRLRIRVQRENLGTFQTVKDTTVTIDADGTASADINSDGRDEALFVIGSTLYCAGTPKPGEAGALLWKLDFPTSLGPPTIADADGDGLVEIILVGADGFVHGVR